MAINDPKWRIVKTIKIALASGCYFALPKGLVNSKYGSAALLTADLIAVVAIKTGYCTVIIHASLIFQDIFAWTIKCFCRCTSALLHYILPMKEIRGGGYHFKQQRE